MQLEPRQILDLVGRAQEAMTVHRVYGEPIERDGVTIIPAAIIQGGGGAGGGGGGGGDATGAQGSGQGGGGGFGIRARPAGAFVIRGDKVRWEPAMDLNKVIAGGQLLTAIGVLLLRSRRRRRRR